MVSNIFIKHGVWWGDTIATQDWKEGGEHHSYISYENQNIKKVLLKYKQRHWKKIHMTPVFPVEGFANDIAKITPANKTWMMKTGVEYFNAFKELNPYNIYIKRSPEGVAKSLSTKRADVVYEDAYEAAVWRFNYMDELQQEFGGVSVNTDNIVNDDFSEMKAAIEYCGLEWNEEAARRAITR
jgi:hypothetical protein